MGARSVSVPLDFEPAVAGPFTSRRNQGLLFRMMTSSIPRQLFPLYSFFGRTFCWQCSFCKKQFMVSPEESFSNENDFQDEIPEEVRQAFERHDCRWILLSYERRPCLTGSNGPAVRSLPDLFPPVFQTLRQGRWILDSRRIHPLLTLMQTPCNRISTGPDMYDTVILSDLHLGSESAHAREALETLQNLSFRRLILLGDIFSDLNFRRLKKEHWRFLSYIRKLSNPKRNVEIVWVEGNHDCGLSEVMSHLVGAPVYQQYIWEHAGRRHLAIHGHQFDNFVIHDTLRLSSFGCYLYLQLQKLDSRRQRFSRFLDRLNTRWMRLTEKAAEGAFAQAKACGAQRVFCGHTHQSLALERDGISYFNCGAWTLERPTYVTIVDEEVTIHEYAGRIDDRYPREERREAAPTAAGFAGDPRLSGAGKHELTYC